ncbi:MAG: hypothetical protein JSW54_04450 [Fidelibacterota bacterium]|nr:MAG: hypothetical protein JSW54_04450 [Candidatus Neomarinimicrobiota bacterium]
MRIFVLGWLMAPLWAAPLPDTSAGLTFVSTYTHFLDALDKDNFDSIFAGVQYYRLHSDDLSTAERDSACKAFMTFFFATISHHNDMIWEDYDFIARFHEDKQRRSPEVADYIDALQRNGLDLYTFGRLYYIDQQPEYLFRNFSRYVSPALRFYLALRSEELAVGFSDSDSLLIAFKEAGVRAIRWEQYLNQHPRSVVADFADYYRQLYLHTFLTGLERTPVFDPEGGLRPELSTVYHEFASRYYDTHAGAIVREFYIILKEADFRWSPKVRDFYIRRRVQNMHTAQIPFR